MPEQAFLYRLFQGFSAKAAAFEPLTNPKPDLEASLAESLQGSPHVINPYHQDFPKSKRVKYGTVPSTLNPQLKH